MPFTNGTYTGLSNSFNDAVSGTIIDPLDWNELFTDIESGINAAVSFLSVKQFGALGDNATNDTAAINAALAAAYTQGKAVFFPAGVYRVNESSGGSGYALFSKGVPMCGEGANRSIIAPMSSMPATASFIRINPVASSDIAMLRMEDLLIYSNIDGAAKGKYGIHLLADVVTNMPSLYMRGVYVAPGNDYSLRIENDGAVNVQGIPSNAIIENCAFWEGANLTFIGDSIAFRNNILRSTGTRIGCSVYQVDTSGVAGHFIFEGNNADCAGGAFKIARGRNVKVLYNNIEQSSGAGSNNAVVDIDGSSGAIIGAEVRGNHIGIFGTATVTRAIRINGTTSAIVDANELNESITISVGLDITASATNALIGYNNFTGFTTDVSDSGTTTRYMGLSLSSSNFTPLANDGGSLGTTTLGWSDLFLASGGVINWNNGDVTITHSSNLLAFAGAASGYSFDAIIYPNANDGAALGSGSNSFSDLFLASGALLNISNGDWIATHSSGILTVGTGDLRVTTAGTNSASVVTVGGTQELDNKTLDSSVGKGTWTASGTWTLPAITLGGTVSGGGNNLNNIIIGASTPLAGTFTTATANSFVPNSSTVPSNGLYLPASNTLGWAINSTGEVQLTSAALSPITSDGNALGTSSLMWSDLFLASGGVINFNSDFTLTHSASTLTASGALAVGGNLTTNGTFTVASGAVIIDLFENDASNQHWYLIADGGQFDFRPTSLGTTSIFQLTTSLVAFTEKAQTTNLFHGRVGTATPAAASAVAAFQWGSAGLGLYWGTGSPNTAFSAAKGSLYVQTDGSGTANRMWINTDGSSAWTNFTTAA